MANSVDELLDSVAEALAGKGGGFAPLLDQDAFLLGTDPGEEFDGPAVIVAAMEQQEATLGVASWSPEGDRRLRSRGEVTWFAEHGTLTFGEQPVRVRLTGVAVSNDGDWRLAQAQVAPARRRSTCSSHETGQAQAPPTFPGPG